MSNEWGLPDGQVIGETRTAEQKPNWYGHTCGECIWNLFYQSTTHYGKKCEYVENEPACPAFVAKE